MFPATACSSAGVSGQLIRKPSSFISSGASELRLGDGEAVGDALDDALDDALGDSLVDGLADSVGCGDAVGVGLAVALEDAVGSSVGVGAGVGSGSIATDGSVLSLFSSSGNVPVRALRAMFSGSVVHAGRSGGADAEVSSCET